MGQKVFSISVVVPIYNESENINQFYDRTIKVLKKLPCSFEMIFINDGSKDNSLDLLIDLNKKDKNTKIINLSRNYGKEIAMTSGIDNTSGDAVIPIDADLQDPPELIPELIKKWQDGYDVVYATRTKRKGESIFKRFSAFVFYKIINMFTQFTIPKNTGDFRLIDKKVVESLKLLRERHRFMKGLFSWVGYKQVGIPYERDPRFAGKTKWNYWKLFNFAVEGITSFSYIPLKFASFFGMIISFCSLVYGLYMFIKTLIIGNPVAGYPSLIVIVLFLGGVQLLTIGTIGEYIGRIYDESKRRELYFIRDKIGFLKK